MGLSWSLATLSEHRHVICCWISFKGTRHCLSIPPTLNLFKAVHSGSVYPERLPRQDRTGQYQHSPGGLRHAACHELLIDLLCAQKGDEHRHTYPIKIKPVCDWVEFPWSGMFALVLGTPCSSGFIRAVYAVWGWQHAYRLSYCNNC